MTRNKLRSQKVLRSLLFSSIACIAFGVACQENPTPPVAPAQPDGTRPAPPGRVVLSPDDTTWNSFTTEVGVLVTGDYPHWGVVDPLVSRSFGFTLTRTALTAGNWANVFAFDPTTPSNLVPDPGDYETNIGRMEHDDFRTYARLYTRAGQVIPMAASDTTVPAMDPAIVAPARDTGSFPRHPTGPGIPMPLPRLGPALGAPAVGGRARVSTGDADARAWIDFFIVGKLGRQRVREQFIRAGATTTVSAEGLEEFTIPRGAERYTVTLDRMSGAPLVLTRHEGAQLLTRETREYLPYDAEAYVLAKSRIESFDAGAASRPVRAFQVQYVNTSLTRAER